MNRINITLPLLQLINIITGCRISDYFFYRWIRTKTVADLDRYITLTTYQGGSLADRLRRWKIEMEEKRLTNSEE
jgi:hypothetical protein